MTRTAGLFRYAQNDEARRLKAQSEEWCARPERSDILFHDGVLASGVILEQVAYHVPKIGVGQSRVYHSCWLLPKGRIGTSWYSIFEIETGRGRCVEMGVSGPYVLCQHTGVRGDRKVGATLESWEVLPTDVSTLTASDLMPYLTCPVESVRIAAQMALEHVKAA